MLRLLQWSNKNIWGNLLSDSIAVLTGTVVDCGGQAIALTVASQPAPVAINAQ